MADGLAVASAATTPAAQKSEVSVRLVHFHDVQGHAAPVRVFIIPPDL
jgi:2',3'-cyclic-nucleotide 2'-phosphodiesterase (5'-nucleotidase family)